MDSWKDHVHQEINQADIDRLLEITRELIHWEDINLVPTCTAAELLDKIEQIHVDNK
jgi:hypothetical protein